VGTVRVKTLREKLAEARANPGDSGLLRSLRAMQAERREFRWTLAACFVCGFAVSHLMGPGLLGFGVACAVGPLAWLSVRAIVRATTREG